MNEITKPPRINITSKFFGKLFIYAAIILVAPKGVAKIGIGGDAPQLIVTLSQYSQYALVFLAVGVFLLFRGWRAFGITFNNSKR